jgi:hypothetical protein
VQTGAQFVGAAAAIPRASPLMRAVDTPITTFGRSAEGSPLGAAAADAARPAAGTRETQ